MITKEILSKVILTLAICFQLLYFFLPPEILWPLFSLMMLSLIIILYTDKSFIIPKTFSLIFGLFIISQLISGLFSVNQFATILQLSKLLGIYTMIVLIFNLNNDKNSFSKKVLNIICLIGSWWALMGILEFTGRTRTQKDFPLFEPFHWPEIAASFYLLIIPTSVYYFITSTKKFLFKIFAFISSYLIINALLLTQKYLVITLSLFVMITGFIFIRLRNTAKKIDRGGDFKEIVLLIILSLVILPNLYFSFGGNKIPKSIALFQDQYFFYERGDVYRFAKSILPKHFLFGIGTDNFGSAYRQNLVKPWVWSDFASNELLQTAIETGILGLLSETILFIYIAITLFKKIRTSWLQNDVFKFFSTLTLIIFLILSFYNASFRVFPVLLVFFIIFTHLTNRENVLKLYFRNIRVPIFILLFLSFLVFTDASILQLTKRYVMKGQYRKGEVLLNFLKEQPPLLINPKTFVWASSINLANGKHIQAFDNLSSMLKLEPYNLELKYQMASLNFASGKTKQAEEFLETQLVLNPYLPPKYYLNLAKIALDHDDKSRAIIWLDKAILIYPVTTIPSSLFLAQLESTGYLDDLQQIYFYLYELTDDQSSLNSLIKLIY
ncbi:hypothetical protein A2960_02400 [Candidatus Gottesmanbacteria bacterium RIFCSPLOWO2_01_FULL_39_12b]|uniref:Uncharacterized protein n=1 Tax=Candidatus Gottesmanbacteria bacterium RIFCSPLOWO2_01_FULL_39_12b TaxID=1798388 RepID=A0A1F6AQK9_9BACT|nr:MAG: hypothetical protein A2960_02400 [Candidatus Gottesmanbacteria bacterium RIFCSPLOWO2_01_FULL_39_12b]